jgi:hypothetical protein
MGNPFQNAKPVDLGSERNPDLGEGTHTYRVVRCLGKEITNPEASATFAFIGEVEVIESTTHRPGARCKYFEGFYKFPESSLKAVGTFCAATYGFDVSNPTDVAEINPSLNELMNRAQSEENILEGRVGKCVGVLGKPSKKDGKRYPRYAFSPAEAKGSIPLARKAGVAAAPPPPAPPAPPPAVPRVVDPNNPQDGDVYNGHRFDKGGNRWVAL